ncbi:MAG: RagB/SusD family nutrient uptake outer membrane protein [Balneolales bacterium]
MKKNIILSLMISTAVMFGCDEGMDNIPSSSVTEESFWERASDAEMALNGVYAEMDGRTITLDNRTDIAFQLYAGSPIVPSDDILSSNWNRYYSGVRRANDLITNIDQIEIGDPAILERLEAEARFLRAYYYTQLTSLWGDVPFTTEPLGINDHLPRTGREEIVDFIINELDVIITSNALPPEYGGDDVGRATHGAAQSLKARAALRNERWAVARDAAQAVIESGVYELYPNYEELFHYEGQNSSEVIFDRQYSPNGTNYDAFGLSASSIGGGSGVEPVHDLYLLYRLDNTEYNVGNFEDPSEAYENLDPRWDYSVFYTGQPIGNSTYDSSPTSTTPDRVDVTETTTELGYNLKKYIDYESDVSSPTTGSINMIHIRYADVLLMYAEAKAQLDEIDQSVYNAINMVRERPTVELEPIDQNTHPDAGSLLAYLQDERAREFAFEGLRLFDIFRWGIGEEVMPGPVLGAHFERSNGEVYLRDAGYSRSFSSHHHLWPIPQAEVNSNSSITENNPGY